MAVYKRYKGRRLKLGDPDWDLGTWQVEFTLRGHYLKEAIPEARTKEEAKRAETDMRQAIYDRRFNRVAGTMLLADFVEQVYEEHVKENHRSWKDDMQRAGEFKNFFEGWQIGDIKRMHVERWKSDLRKRVTKFGRKMSPSTVNRYLFTASKIFSLAVSDNLVDANPVSSVEKLTEPPPRDRWLSGEEEDLLLPALLEGGEHLAAFGESPLNVGFRAGELLSRRWVHVNLQAAYVDIDQTKNERPRRVPLNSRALAILRSLRQGAADHELIFDPLRTGRKRRQMLYKFAAAVQRVGIDNFHYHDTRHTFATKLRAAGVHEYDIADLLGHSTTSAERRDTKVTRGYAHGIPSRLREAVESICNLNNVVEFCRKNA